MASARGAGKGGKGLRGTFFEPLILSYIFSVFCFCADTNTLPHRKHTTGNMAAMTSTTSMLRLSVKAPVQAKASAKARSPNTHAGTRDTVCERSNFIGVSKTN